MPVNSPNNQPLYVSYGQTQGLISVFNPPTISNRAPGVNDRKAIGALWVNKLLNNAYILTSITNNQANWILVVAGGGTAIFNSLTVNPGPTNLSTVGNGAVNIGSATNTGAITINTGTGNFLLDGNGNSIFIGTDNAANSISIGSSNAGADTLIVGGAGTFVGTPAISLITGATGDITIGGAAHTGKIYIGTSTAGETINIGTTLGANTINIGNNNTTTSVTITSGSGNIDLAGETTCNSTFTANGLYTINDGGGIALTTGFTNVTATSAGVGTVTFAANGAVNIVQSGWMKVYIGVTPAYIPYFTSIT